MAEKAMNALELIKVLKSEVGKENAGSGNFANMFYFKKGESTKKVRFITDLNDALIMKFDEKKVFQGETEYAHPCLTQYGKECPTCKLDSRPKQLFLLTVYDYSNEYEPRRLMAEKYGMCSPIPTLSQLYNFAKTIGGRDFEMTILKAGTKDKSYDFSPVDDSEDFDKEVAQFTLEEALEEFKKDKFRFILPNGVFFTELKDLPQEPF